MDHFGFFMLGAAVAVGASVGLAVRIIQLIVGRIRGHGFTRSVGRPAALGWALGFAIAAFAAAAVVSIGWLVLPFAMIACGVAAWRCRALPEGAVGASLGTGIVLYVIGLMNPTSPPCAAMVTIRSGDRASLGCGGVDGTSWLPLALALIVVAVAGQLMIEVRNKGRAHTNGAPSPT